MSQGSSASSMNTISNEISSTREPCLSPENRQSNIHARNSSKILKCPKCNWHYKYQETLEIHMKEKHQIGIHLDGQNNTTNEQEINCIYCFSNSVHPRLARGEQYPCGFKPYRCELCLYSTTTKGNLAIHMQSDKHLNNCRDFSSPTLISASLASSPENFIDSSTSPSTQSQPQVVSVSSSSSLVPTSEPIFMAENNEKCPLSNEEYRCHCCVNQTFDDVSSLLSHLEDLKHQEEEKLHSTKSSGYLCWKRGCNQYFHSVLILETHFNEIHLNSKSMLINSNDSNNSSTDHSLIFKESSNQLKRSLSSSSSTTTTTTKDILYQTISSSPSSTHCLPENKSSSPWNFPSKSRERLISIGEDLVLHYLENLQNDQNKTEILCDLCLKQFSSLSTLKVHYEDIHSVVLSSRAIQHWIFLLQKLHQTSSSHSDESNKQKFKRPSSSASILNPNDSQMKKIRPSHFDKNSSSSLNGSLTSLIPSALCYTATANSTSSSPVSSIHGNHLQFYNLHDFVNGKRQRTRITDEQLQILRAHFDINNSPSDEQIHLIAEKTQLTTKVIKHWFRNTLFKERQRNKDSPYNFSIPPSSLDKFDLDEYQKTGTIIKKPLQSITSTSTVMTTTTTTTTTTRTKTKRMKSDISINTNDFSDSDKNDYSSNDEQDLLSNSDLNSNSNSNSDNEHFYGNNSFPHLSDTLISKNTQAFISSPLLSSMSQKQQQNQHQYHHHHHQQQTQQQQQQQSRRANRTRFTDQQLRLLQDAFESNPYPKDDDLEILSQKLKLNSRVIVVWFQNARQKARKSYENHQIDQQQPAETIIKPDKDEGYPCKNCQKQFTRFAELMKHAKQCSASSNSLVTSAVKKINNPPIKKDLIKSESIDHHLTSTMDPLASYQMLMATAAAAAAAANSIPSTIPHHSSNSTMPSGSSLTTTASSSASKKKENFCDQCNQTFSSLNEFHEHQNLHMQALINAAAFFPFAAYHPAAAAACAAAVAASAFNTPLFHHSSSTLNGTLGSIGTIPNLPIGSFPLQLQSSTAPSLSNPIENEKEKSKDLSKGRLKSRKSSMESESSNENGDDGDDEDDLNNNRHEDENDSEDNIGDDDDDGDGEDGGTSLDSSDDHRKLTFHVSTNPKRNRTTILPEQQDYLMLKYSEESNPSRKMLEEISSEVKLRKRVVQVWFQNTRARERKGNIKIDGFNHFEKTCPICSITLKSKIAYENHLLTKHTGEPNMKNYQLSTNSVSDRLPKSKLFGMTDDLPLDLSKSSQSTNNTFHDKGENSVDHRNRKPTISIDQSNDESDDQFSDQDLKPSRYISQTNSKISSLTNGHLSPTDSHQSSSNGIHGQRRFRTQMTPLQIKLMKAIFLEYRTPTMPECELLGKEIDLQKRVVQVWFQNARAKEKKNPNFFKSDLPEEYQSNNESCLLCNCKYSLQNPQRDHLFTSKHIENIRSILLKHNQHLSSIKDDSFKKNSNKTVDLDKTPTSVLDKTAKDDQNSLISYFNLINLMPLGIDPFNYGLIDPNIHGIPILMLQLPCQAIEDIFALIKRDPTMTRAQYTQDGKTLKDFVSDDSTSIEYQTIDVGFVCKKCHLVWPLYESCRCHLIVCWQISSTQIPLTINTDDDLNSASKYLFKIEQLLYKCSSCQSSYSTIVEYEKHTHEDNHLKIKSSNRTIQENDSFKLK